MLVQVDEAGFGNLGTAARQENHGEGFLGYKAAVLGRELKEPFFRGLAGFGVNAPVIVLAD